ncbi:MAG TPA: rhomboid family intramembrane serine protease [Candidatus Angelobacter sp.]|nr:rhomboid family intramembrane serine protease [Candidatus Angelobacter sp.]
MATRICATCGREFALRFGDTAFTRNCPTCDLKQYGAAGQAPLIPAAAGTADAPTFPITIGLIALNALIFGIMVLRGVSPLQPTPQDALAFGADFGPLTFGGQWWRLVTSMFVHYGAVHIGLNMWCLWNLGRAAERLLGRFSYLLAYFASGIFGSIASVYWHPLGVGAGASGAIFGIAGVLVSFVYLKKTPAHLQLNKNMLGSLGTFILYNLAFGAAIPGISNAAHLGGLVMGLAVGALLPAAAASEPARRTRLSLLVALSTIALVASAAAAKHLRAGTAELAAIQKLISQRRSDEAIAQLQQLTAREPQLAPAQAMLASQYFAKGRLPEAIAALEKACEADPHNLGYKQQLGSAYLTTGQFDRATAFFQQMTRDDPGDARGFLGLGYAYMGRQQYDSAIAEFREAVALDPKSPGSQYALGQAQLKAGRFADAQATYRQLLAQFPNDPRAKAALDFATRQAH